MPLKEKISRISLIILVSISLVLSYFIWMSPIQSPQKEESPQVNLSSQPTAMKANTEVFLPSQLIWHQELGKKVSTKESLITDIQQQLEKSEIGELTLRYLTEEKEYQEILQTKDGVELDYVGNFILNEYARVYKIPFKKIPKAVSFNRILIDFSKDKIFVLNDKEKKVYEGSITINKSAYLAYLNKNIGNYVDATIGNSLLPYYYYTTKPLSLPMYSYIVSTQPYTTFTRAFFETPNDFTISNNSDELLYDTSKGESLEISNNTGKVFFKTKRKLATEDSREQTGEINLFRDSYNYISRLGVQLGNIRYFDEEQSILNFTTYIEGYPLFSKDNRGQLHFRFNQDGKLEIATNVQAIQIPIPSEEEITLKSTADVLTNLQSFNVDSTKIDNLQIGYEWQIVEETSQVVNLIPQWFVHYENHWYSESELIAQTGKEGGK